MGISFELCRFSSPGASKAVDEAPYESDGAQLAAVKKAVPNYSSGIQHGGKARSNTLWASMDNLFAPTSDTHPRRKTTELSTVTDPTSHGCIRPLSETSGSGEGWQELKPADMASNSCLPYFVRHKGGTQWEWASNVNTSDANHGRQCPRSQQILPTFPYSGRAITVTSGRSALVSDTTQKSVAGDGYSGVLGVNSPATTGRAGTAGYLDIPTASTIGSRRTSVGRYSISDMLEPTLTPRRFHREMMKTQRRRLR
ncbi:hypothetical protein ERJ75_000428900 [Trypanosoma vivax]|nr:hypothetical protein ERJ75_000428900 [Trypanosoma vivax]